MFFAIGILTPIAKLCHTIPEKCVELVMKAVWGIQTKYSVSDSKLETKPANTGKCM